MHGSPMHYFPIAWPFLLLIGLLLAFAIVLVELRVLRYAFEKIGLSRRAAIAVLLLTLFGSYINIPIAELPPEPVFSGDYVDFAGVRYVIPPAPRHGTVLAVNVGGAVIPTIVSLYLLLRYGFFARAFLGVIIVAAIVHQLAQPVRGVGIAVPVFIPPIASAATALILGRRDAPALAYISGSMGALIGADLMNLGHIQGLGAPVASIGGAGTFDGIFVTGILAVLITPFTGPRPVDRVPPPQRPAIGNED